MSATKRMDVAGVKRYQTVFAAGAHDGVGSPASVVAPSVAIVSANGSVVTAFAVANASFGGGAAVKSTLSWPEALAPVPVFRHPPTWM